MPIHCPLQSASFKNNAVSLPRPQAAIHTCYNLRNTATTQASKEEPTRLELDDVKAGLRSLSLLLFALYGYGDIISAYCICAYVFESLLCLNQTASNLAKMDTWPGRAMLVGTRGPGRDQGFFERSDRRGHISALVRMGR